MNKITPKKGSKYQDEWNSVLTFASSEFNTPVSTPRQLKSAISTLTKELKGSRTEGKQSISITQQETQIVQCNTIIRDLKLENEILNKKLSDTLERIKTLENEKEQSEKKQIQNFEKENYFLELFSNFDATHTEDVSTISKQRTTLLNLINRYDTLCKQYEDRLMLAQDELTEFKKEYHKLEIKFKRSSTAITKLYQNILKIVPNGLLDPYEKDPEAGIISLIQALLSTIETAPRCTVERDLRADAVASQLEAAVSFLHSIVNSTSYVCPDSALGNNENLRKEIIVQCERIHNFMEETISDLDTSQSTVFDASGQSKIKAFIEVVSGDDLSQSPLRELFAMFTAVVDINQLLMNRIEYEHLIFNDTSAPQPDELLLQEIDRLKAERENLLKQNDELFSFQTQVQDILQCKRDEIVEAAKISVDKISDLESENQILVQKNKQLSLSCEDEPELRKQVAEQKLQIEELNLQHHEEISNLSQQINAMNQTQTKIESDLSLKIDGLTLELEKKEKMLKKAEEKESQTKTMIDRIQEKAITLLEENRSLSIRQKDMEGAISRLEIELTKSQAKVKKHRAEKSEYHSQLQIATVQNSDLLADLKRTSEEIQTKNESTIKQLQNELDICKKKICDLEAARTSLVKEKADLVNQSNRLKATEKALQMKIGQLEKRSEIQKESNAAQQKAQIMQTQRTIEQQALELKEKDQMILRKLLLIIGKIKILEDQPNNTQDAVEALDEIIAKMNVPLLKEAEELKISSLTKYVKKLQSERERAVINQEMATAKVSALSEEIMHLKRKFHSQNDYYDECQKWLKWARILLRARNQTPDQMRNEIKEKLLMSVGDQTIQKQIETLRKEKQMLLNGAMPIKKKLTKKATMKETVMTIIALVRIANATGNGIPVLPIVISPPKQTQLKSKEFGENSVK